MLSTVLRPAVAALFCFSATAASAQSMLVSVSELSGMLKDPNVVVLDIAASVKAFEDGHIPGARYVRYADFAVEGADRIGSELPSAEEITRVFEAAGVSDDTRVVIYAQSPVTAARAFFTLDVFGHGRVALLDGGLRAWRESGQPLETGPSSSQRTGRLTPRLNAQRLADAAFIQKQTPGQSIALLDVRPDDEYSGNHTMGGMHAPGHIAGARQLTWNSLVDGSGRFLPREQLQQRLEAAGVVAGRPAVAYCMVGMRASVVYFVSRMLGYDARLYDGSIMDWSRRKLPTVQN
jgi:thiosulfate/3-mercaptopyruvate sulfurtransferase